MKEWEKGLLVKTEIQVNCCCLFVCLPLIVVCCMIVVVVCLPLIVSIKASSQIVFDSVQYLMLAIQIPSNT